jgi:hypothetical protein
MAINHGPLDITLDKRDDPQLEMEEAMIDVATSRGQEEQSLETPLSSVLSHAKLFVEWHSEVNCLYGYADHSLHW